MGDIFDSRKSIDLQSLEWSKRVVFEPLKKNNVYAIVGNHDCYYKNTNDVNSPELLLRNYPNINVYSKATEIELNGFKILMLPWINSENYEETEEGVRLKSFQSAMTQAYAISIIATHYNVDVGFCGCFIVSPSVLSFSIR